MKSVCSHGDWNIWHENDPFTTLKMKLAFHLPFWLLHMFEINQGRVSMSKILMLKIKIKILSNWYFPAMTRKGNEEQRFATKVSIERPVSRETCQAFFVWIIPNMSQIIPNVSPNFQNVPYGYYSSLIFGINIFDVGTPSHQPNHT